jgi:hypothetical protein
MISQSTKDALGGSGTFGLARFRSCQHTEKDHA